MNGKTKRRVLVTGGFGFIGSHLVDIVLDRGDECAVVDSLFHAHYPHVDHLAGRADHRKVSILDRDALDKVFRETKPQDVYHLAAHHFIPYCDSHPVDALETNIVGTQNIADLCREHGAEKLFLASTAAVYGISDTPHIETESPDPVDIYGVTKYAAERIVWFLSRRSDVKVRVGRYFNAVGNRETNPHIIPEIIQQLNRTAAQPALHLGNTFPKRDYIHAADLALGSVTMVTSSNEESYDVANIGSGKEFSVMELIEMFSRDLGVPIDLRTDPTKLRKVDRPHLCANNGKLVEKYGWAPRYELPDIVRELTSLVHLPQAAEQVA